MKKKILLMGFLLSLIAEMFGQLLQQDFSSSTTVSSYVNATPSNGQFNSISTSGAGTVLSINTTGSNKLRFARSGTNAGSYARTTDFSPTPVSLMYRFDLTVSANSSATTTAAMWQIGSGFGTANSTEANASTHSRLGLNVTATAGQFSLRDMVNSVNTANFSGTQTVTWVINNSGGLLSYQAPDGTEESIGNDSFDLWVGTTKAFDNKPSQTASQTLTDIKFVFNNGTATVDIDNILIDPIPAKPTSSAATNLHPNRFTANWTAVSGVTGYRIDVHQDAAFTSPVIDDLYISGQSTSSTVIDGLNPNTTYYYRIRAASQYTVGEFAGENSTTQTVTTPSCGDITLPSASGTFTRYCTEASWIYYGSGSQRVFGIDTLALTGSLTNDTVYMTVGTAIDSFKSSSGVNQEHASFLPTFAWNAKGNFSGNLKIQIPYVDTNALKIARDNSYAALLATNSSTLAVRTNLEYFKTDGVPYDITWKTAILGNKFPNNHIKLTPIYGNNGVTDYVQFSPITSFSGGSFGYGYGPPGSSGTVGLPVEMYYFEIQIVSEEGNTLIWKTSSELHNSGFIIQRSYDGSVWENIAFMPSQSEDGNSQSDLIYKYTDEDFSSIVYYRLIQKDLPEQGGRETKSDVKVAKRIKGKEFDVTVNPNPITLEEPLKIKILNIDRSPVYMQILNSEGKPIMDKRIIPEGDYINHQWYLGLSSGLYFVNISNYGNVYKTRIQVK